MKRKLYASILISAMMLASNAQAATWCQPTNIKDIICYSDKTCFVTADAYGGVRYYLIAANDENKSSMVAVALSVLSTKTRARLAFTQNNLNCNDIPQNSQIFGIGATE